MIDRSIDRLLDWPIARLPPIRKVAGASNAAFSTGGSIIGPDDTIYVTGNKDVSGNKDSLNPVPPAAKTHGLVTAYELGNGAFKWQTDLGATWEANNAASIGRLNGVCAPPQPLTPRRR